ncbi:hypothetical protein XMD420_000956 [Marinobacterium sp. xm-d-420]|uniref:hypothetical protein n=1 Tax=Marinobacterium sp. xm-d-420 TaxID=2497737 RepID=UPI0015684DBA|nr:hypothetical protein [Marinobacterium sp. xm-d-420]NRP27353.1 hypothetical protein [Marinobacterium sp. xm-d-420]
MTKFPYQHPDELLYGGFQANDLKPKDILDYLTHLPKPNEGKGLLDNLPTSQGQQPTTLWECLGLEDK